MFFSTTYIEICTLCSKNTTNFGQFHVPERFEERLLLLTFNVLAGAAACGAEAYLEYNIMQLLSLLCWRLETVPAAL